MTDKRRIYFRDGLAINQPAKKEIIDEALNLLQRDNGASLSIQIDATHSGLLTNGRVYPGVKVRKGYKSYVSVENGGSADYNKPILKHHDAHSDPIGRIIGAQFVRLKTGDAFTKDFLTPDIPGKGSGKGSGVVRVTANIMETDAIQKILDGRLLTVSSGHHTDSMSCSLCGNQLFYGYDGSVCEHIPGQYYDDDDFKGLCYGITGDLIYDEISLVTRPAQSSAMIVKVDWDSTKQADSLEAGNLLLNMTDRGKKAHFHSMVLQDGTSAIDLISAKTTDKTNKVLVSFAQDNVISSVLGDMSSEDSDLSDFTETEGTTGEDRDEYTISSGTFNTNATFNTSIELGDVSKDRQESNKAGKGSANDNSSLGDGATHNTMTNNKNDGASVESLQMEKAQLQLDMKEKDKQITDLQAQLDKKDAEVQRLIDDAAQMQTDLSRDYATLVAKYRALLDKPGAKFDSEEDYNKHLEDLSKRTVDSLRDSLEDLKIEFAEKQAKDSQENKDQTDRLDEGRKVTSPSLKDENDDADAKTPEIKTVQDEAANLFS